MAYRIAVVWRGDRTARQTATAANNRFCQVFAALAARGIQAEPAVFDEDFAEEVRDQLLAVRWRARLGRSDPSGQDPRRRSTRCCAMSPRTGPGSAPIPT